MTIGQPEGGFLDTVGRWSFEAGAGQVVRVTAESDAFDTVIQLRSSAGEVLAENDDCSVTTDSCLETTIPLAGRYEIWVTAFFNGTGLYTVAVQTVTATPLTTSTATTGRLGEDDQTVERGFFEAGARNVMAQETGPVTELMYARVHLENETERWPFETGRWSFGGRASQTVEVEVASDDFDTVVGLMSPAGLLLHVNDDGGSGTNSLLVATLPDDGLYQLLVMVHPFNAAAEGGVYEVTVREVSEARDVVREREAFITIGTTERSTLDAERPETGDWSFEGRSGQTVEVEVASDDFDTVVGLMSPAPCCT